MKPIHVDVPPDEPYYPVHYAATAVDTVEDLGVDPGPYLRRAGLSRPTLYTWNLLISRDQYLTLLRGLLENDLPGFGLKEGRRTRFEDYGIVGYAMYSSNTLGQAIERHMRYQPLLKPSIGTRLAVVGKQAFLESPVLFPDVEAEPLVKRFLLEEHFAAWQVVAMCFQVQMHWFTELHLAYPRPDYAPMYEEVFGCPVFFDASLSKACFPRRQLDAPFVFANYREARLAEDQCAALLKGILHKGGIVGAIHQLLSRAPGRFPRIENMASNLGMSERTLRRRLSAEGTTYSRVLVDFRLNLARQYLHDTVLPVQEIALLVGYAEAASFHRAFRRQFGQTPDQFRRAAARI